ncbi:triacylglycerol lipase 2 [Canna indica]|uniref:Lipase n=1 Tax=Canna indica TaxID=4628 RepID=A0AAQ3KZ35_9LILI|nr:triacylglycerol lipase 2 [Canna indica]
MALTSLHQAYIWMEYSFNNGCFSRTLLFLLFFFNLPQDIVGARSVGVSDVTSNVGGLCASVVIHWGYKCQEFKVQTKDGYILGIQRIPRGRNGRGKGKRPPVLLQHGILVDGLTWVLNSPEESLAFILADNGFDVWIANTRGTKFSQAHVSLSVSQPAYWAWSWDELVSYDLPATVDFVYQQTGQKLNYVGHSMGTLIALSSLSEGKLVDKMQSAALLSPIAYLSHMTTPLGVTAAKAFAGEIAIGLGVAEFNPLWRVVKVFLNSLCLQPGVNCFDMLTEFTGNNCCLNSSTVEFTLKFEPQPTSTKALTHLSQTVRDGVIRKYNYDSKEGNMRHYGQTTPPVYNMSNIPKEFPLFLSYGGQDALSNVKDVLQLLDDLKLHGGDKLTVQYVQDYGHADFVMATNAKEFVYDAVISFFNRQ